MRRALTSLPRRRTLVVLGLVTVCVAATAAASPAYAGPSRPAGTQERGRA
jgi:hypothetical protein